MKKDKMIVSIVKFDVSAFVREYYLMEMVLGQILDLNHPLIKDLLLVPENCAIEI